MVGIVILFVTIVVTIILILFGINEATGLVIKSNAIVDSISFREYGAVSLEFQGSVIVLILICLCWYCYVISNLTNSNEDWKNNTSWTRLSMILLVLFYATLLITYVQCIGYLLVLASGIICLSGGMTRSIYVPNPAHDLRYMLSISISITFVGCLLMLDPGFFMICGNFLPI